MGALIAESLKLKCSLAWPIVVGVPLVLVLAGAVTQLARGTTPKDGWDTVWLQSVGFYGLFPLAVAVAILGSLVWRAEHRGSNWNALMSTPTSTLQIVAAKTAMVAGLTSCMQIVLVVAVVLVGKMAFGLPALLPGKDIAVGMLLMLATIPVAALQSALSLFLRSFAGPVALALVGSGLSTAALMALDTPAIVSPYALATKTTMLGTGTFGDSGTITAADVIAIAVASIVVTILVVVGTAKIVDRRDTRI